jgi:UDP-N-acetylglucosamine 1-carboxyvinyltransferase
MWYLQGSKNSCSPIMAATLLLNNKITLRNCPNTSDVNNMINLLKQFNLKINFINNDLTIDSSDKKMPIEIDYSICTPFKHSYYIIGSSHHMINKFKYKCLNGCKIGQRPIDQHIKLFSKLGKCDYDGNNLIIENNYIGDLVFKFSKKTVGGTTNAILSRALCNYNTTLLNCQYDESIEELCNFLKNCGLDIKMIDKSKVIIKPTKKLSLKNNVYSIVYDPIVTFTYLVFQNLLKKKYNLDFYLENVNLKTSHNIKIKNILEKNGFEIINNNNKFKIVYNENFKHNNICEIHFDSEITDSMPFIVLLFVEYGIESYLIDDIYEKRTNSYNHLINIGYTNLKIVENNKVQVFKRNNNDKFKKIPFINYDLRGDACNLIANLINKTYDSNFSNKYLYRGYDSLQEICDNLSKIII